MPSVTPFPGTIFGQHQQPKLLDRVRIATRTRHYSLRTEEAYVGWIKRYIFFHNKRHPLEMGELEINAFLSRLAVKDHVSASTQNQALWASSFSTATSWKSPSRPSRTLSAPNAPSACLPS